jgi:hypothetical protein
VFGCTGNVKRAAYECLRKRSKCACEKKEFTLAPVMVYFNPVMPSISELFPSDCFPITTISGVSMLRPKLNGRNTRENTKKHTHWLFLAIH